MSTFTGHYNILRFLAGMQATGGGGWGSRLRSEHEHTGHVGTVASIEPLGPAEDATDIGFVMDTYLVQACLKCHANAPGPNDGYGNYRSSGLYLMSYGLR